MQTHTPIFFRSLIGSLTLICLGATAQNVVVVVSPDPVAFPVSTPPHKRSFVSLIAAASLDQQGLTNPTTADLGAAESQVQAMRDSGMGWGAIANSMNLRLGDVVSAANREPRSSESISDRSLRTTPRDGNLVAASNTNKSAPGNGKSGGQGAGASGGNAGASKGGGANNGNSGGGKGGGNSGGNGGGKGGGNSGGKGGGKR